MSGQQNQDHGPDVQNVRTVRLTVQYDGTAYRGFVRQRQGGTIQAELEAELSVLLQHRVRVVPAGRTDAGVHAAGQVVSFRTQREMAHQVLERALNARLPEDIAVLAAADAEPDFHARRSARARWYRYTVWRGRHRNVWCRRYSYHLVGGLDVEAMREASRLLVGEHDFGAFATGLSGDGPAGRGTRRTVYRADWSDADDFLYFDIRADGFLRQMVRGIVGTLLRVGRGQMSLQTVAALLDGAPRSQAGPNVPARGLSLMGVEYR